MSAADKGRRLLTHNEHLRRALPVAVCLCLVLWPDSHRSVAAEEIHSFVDERGVSHFSNVPADPRYRPYLRATIKIGVAGTTDRPSVILFAPPLVAPGGEFIVNVLLAAPSEVYGWVDITFDPEALTPGVITVEHELPSANIVRVKVHGGPSADFSAELHFRANASRISSTNIGLGEAALRTGSSGKPVVTRKSPAASIAFLSLGQ